MAGTQLDTRGIVITCPKCGQANRVAYAAADKTTRCGKCQADLPMPDSPVEVPDSAAFSALITQSALPVLVDFWAEWCGPCRMVAPELAKVATARAGRLLVAKVDTEALGDVAMQFGIQSIPTMALFQAGREVTRTSGARPAAGILSFIDQAL